MASASSILQGMGSEMYMPNPLCPAYASERSERVRPGMEAVQGMLTKFAGRVLDYGPFVVGSILGMAPTLFPTVANHLLGGSVDPISTSAVIAGTGLTVAAEGVALGLLRRLRGHEVAMPMIGFNALPVILNATNLATAVSQAFH